MPARARTSHHHETLGLSDFMAVFVCGLHVLLILAMVEVTRQPGLHSESVPPGVADEAGSTCDRERDPEGRRSIEAIRTIGTDE
jgi:hypothetical protein